MKRIIADYHMHSISPDARIPMEKMCLAAIERGLTEIAVTDHVEIYAPDYQGKEPLMFDDAYLDRYFVEWEHCREKFDGRLIVRRGIELGQPDCNRENAKRILEKYHFDYVLGSIHKLYAVDLAFKHYSERTNDSIARKNLELLYELADIGDFDCMGHIDLIKRYATRQGQQVSLMKYPEELTAILKRLVERGKGLEINTSGLRQGLGETLPALDILKLYRQLGGEVLTVGSDAHRDTDVAADFDAALELALAAGFTKLALYENRKCSFYSIAD
ncbi:histidinol-phosphatase HisJ family protein [Hydrogenoanaerobacterium sp.]|uniref:histidinol-phosphatase HisJ family protein n=1 Tax=Hydrogenoanaerobacterium sp. TaxID=2953763 RepID=UPI00289AF3CA|nr:histidinol-phosphatase HisJ family protein [Hydrogenoanaerobacterium sp.]